LAAEKELKDNKLIMVERNLLVEELDGLFLQMREDYKISDKLTGDQ
jgi:hypothetical protein